MLHIRQPEKKLLHILSKNSGRDNSGHVSVRHQGGRHKRFYRMVDFKREKTNVSARVVSIEYDPNRTADVALLHYTDGDKRYIVAPLHLQVGDVVKNGSTVDVKAGNALPLGAIPIGTVIHNIEIVPGKGAKLIRSAGSQAMILAKEENFVHVKMPSGEVRKIENLCMATVGQVGNEEWQNEQIGKAGRARHMGKRPEVRGVAQNPRTHPHGGGEGRSGVGMPSPKSPWGKKTLGKKTRKHKKYSDRYILQRKK